MSTPLQPFMGANPVATPAEPLPKIGKFKASKMIAFASWDMLKQDREMLWFPVLSVLSTFIAAVVFVFGYSIVTGNDFETFLPSAGDTAPSVVQMTEILLLFGWFLVTTFIATFFQAGVVAIVDARIKGGDLTLGDGLRIAAAHAAKLFVWSMLHATVGVVLHMIAERSKLLGRLVTSLLGAAWSILTFFIVPVLILEDKRIHDSLKRSGEVIKQTWGETIIVNVGVGLFMFVLMLIGIAAFIGSLFLGSGTLVLLALVLLVLYIVGLVLIASTLSIVFKVVLYEYATHGTLPAAFPEQVIRYAFTPRT